MSKKNTFRTLSFFLILGVSLAAQAQLRNTISVQELYNDVTRQVARSDGAFLVDLAHALPKDSRLFYDFMHYTNEGAARLGDIVATHLEPMLRRLRS